MNFLVHDKEVLNKYNKIWDKIKNLFEKKNVIVTKWIMINTLKLNQVYTIWNFIVIKSLKKMNIILIDL